MQKPMVYHLNNELVDIFQQEIKELHQDVAAITMEKFHAERYYEDLVSEEREEKQALLLEIQELKEKLEKAESKDQGLVGRDETMSCPTTLELQQEIKEMQKKHRQEIEMLTIELEIDLAVAKEEIKKLQDKLENERNLDAKGDSAKRETAEIPLQFSSHKTQLDLQQLEQTIQKETALRVQAESLLEILDQELKTERELRAQVEADKEEAVEIAEQLIKKLEDLEKTSQEAPSDDDRDKFELELQQLEKMLQEEKRLRVQGETKNASLLKTVEFLRQETNKERLKPMVYHLNNELFDIFQQEIKELHQNVEAITMEKFNTKLCYEDLVSEERKEKQALLLEIQELKEKLEKEKSFGAKREAIKIPLQLSSHGEGLTKVSAEYSTEIPHLDVRQLHEMLQRERELRIQAENENLDKFKCAEAFFEMMEQELKTERERRAQTEADKQEAVEIAEQLIKKLEDVEKTSKEAPSEITLADQNKIQLDLQQLKKMLQEEKALRVQAENFLEILDEELKTERELRAQTESDKEEAVEIAEQLIQKLENVENMSKEGLDDRDKIQLDLQQLEKTIQEEKRVRVQAENLLEILDQELKKELELRAQTEADKEEAVEIAEQLIKKLENVENMSKEGPTEISLDDRDKIQLDLQQLEKTIQEEKRVRVQAESLLEILDQELKTERELRAQVEADKEEAVEIAEQLIKKLEDVEKTSKEAPSEITLADQIKIQLELQQLEKMLQEEKRLRVQAETENASLLKTAEFLRQETAKELQKERALREEAERGKLELEKVSDKLYPGFKKACTMTETLSAKTILLTNKLQAEDKKQRPLLKDIQELTLLVEKEKALRIKSENYEMEAIEIVEEKEAKYRTRTKKNLKKKRHLIKVQPF